MKNGFLKNVLLVWLLGSVAMVSMGCLSMEEIRAMQIDPTSRINDYELVETFIDKTIPYEQQSRLYVTTWVGAFDETSSLKGVAERHTVMVFPAGKHDLKVKGINSRGEMVPFLSLGLELTVDFLPGHSYIAYSTPNGSSTTVQIKDIEDFLKEQEYTEESWSKIRGKKPFETYQEANAFARKAMEARIINTNEKLKALK